MKTYCAAFLAAILTGTVAAEESQSRAAVPQPRVRLDPNTRAAIAEPKKKNTEPTDSVIMMSPFVVKSIAIATNEPEQEKQSRGPFSPLTGGWIMRNDTGGMRVEVGAWPYENIMWKSDRFKSDLKHAGTEFFRISW